MVIATSAELKTTKITLEGIQWATFRALMAESERNYDYRVVYDSGLLQIEYAQAKSSLAQGTILFNGISWPTYKAIMNDVGDGRAWRIAYDCGVLEIRMPLINHEKPKIMLSNFVEVLADELEIEICELGALTLEREDLTRAIEPDTCFYVQNELVIRSLQTLDLPNDPPPDLAIESDNTNSSLNKHKIYAALGVPELWRYRKQQLEIYQLVEGQYVQVDRSLAFPCLPVAEVSELIERSREVGQRSAVRLFRARIREILQT